MISLNIKKLSLLSSLSFAFIPISFIAGNLLINLNLVFLILFGLLFVVQKNFKLNIQFLHWILIFFYNPSNNFIFL